MKEREKGGKGDRKTGDPFGEVVPSSIPVAGLVPLFLDSQLSCHSITALKSHRWNVKSENTTVPFVRAGLPLLVMSWQVIRALSVPWKGSRVRSLDPQNHKRNGLEVCPRPWLTGLAVGGKWIWTSLFFRGVSQPHLGTPGTSVPRALLLVAPTKGGCWNGKVSSGGIISLHHLLS